MIFRNIKCLYFLASCFCSERKVYYIFMRIKVNFNLLKLDLSSMHELLGLILNFQSNVFKDLQS